MKRLRDYVESWRFSRWLAANPEWRRQVAESQKRWDTESEHEGVTATEIRSWREER